MKYVAVIGLFTLTLVACASIDAWLDSPPLLISTYRLEKVPEGIVLKPEEREEEKVRPLLSPGLLLGDALYMQLESINPYQLTKSGVPAARYGDYPYSIEVWFSAKSPEVAVDVTSFELQRAKNMSPLRPLVFTTLNRDISNPAWGQSYSNCGWYGGEVDSLRQQRPTGLVPVPLFHGTTWPTQDHDYSVVCMALIFNVLQAEMSPEQHFQLHFRYQTGSQYKEVTVYFYPAEYHVINEPW